MNFRLRLLNATDRLLAGTIVLLLAGTTVAFGGRVWWAPPAVAVLCLALILLGALRLLLEGSFRVFKSPLTALGLLVLGLAAVQLVPLPTQVSARLSPGSHGAYAFGFLPERARALEPTVDMPEAPTIRSPVSIDRPATLRWLAGGAACLVVFWSVARFADRLGHLYLVWGSVVGAFFLNTAIVLVQMVCKARGVYGFIDPGKGPAWAPTWIDLLDGPNASVLRVSEGVRPGHPTWALAVPDRPFFLGSQMGGPGAYLALGSIALPLALALTLHLIAPRGSREPLSTRLRHSGQGSLVTLVYGLLLASAALVGLIAGPLFCLPFAAGLGLVGLPSAGPTGLRWTAVGLTFLALTALGSGAAAGQALAGMRTSPVPVVPETPSEAVKVWGNTLEIVKDFPVLGTGLGTFGSIYPAYKQQDGASTTAMSSLLQWWVESGLVGLGLVLLAGLWCLFRLPGALKHVGTGDRALAFGLIGAAAAFTLFSAVHWTVELTSVALAASALAGASNRWLSGGTDLFVERG